MTQTRSMLNGNAPDAHVEQLDEPPDAPLDFSNAGMAPARQSAAVAAEPMQVTVVLAETDLNSIAMSFDMNLRGGGTVALLQLGGSIPAFEKIKQAVEEFNRALVAKAKSIQ